MVKYLDVRIDLGAETGQDARVSVQATQGRLAAVQDRLRETATVSGSDQLIPLLIEQSGLLIELNRMEEAWASARRAFEQSVEIKQWDTAARACEMLFRTEREQSLAALGQGIWLAVTFPVDPELTVSLLGHVVDETPDRSDGAAVAAAAAVYIVDLRASGQQHEELSVHTRQILTAVARRHSAVQNQLELDAWMERLELNDVDKLLGRLRTVVDALVQDDWWIDQQAVQAEIPDQ